MTVYTTSVLRNIRDETLSGITATSVATILKTYGDHIQDDRKEAVSGPRNK